MSFKSILREIDPDAAVQTINLAFLGDPVEAPWLEFLTETSNLNRPNTVLDLTETYYESEEFQESWASRNDEALVRTVIYNLFDRNATEKEVDRWSDKLDAGMDESQLMWRILGRASEQDMESYEAKLFIADYATEQAAKDEWTPDELTFTSLYSNPELYSALHKLADDNDEMTLEQYGESVKGNPLYAATVGEGEKSVVFMTQQHGDEPIGTQAALYLLDFLTSGTDLADQILEEVTITVMPRVNPDGFARWEEAVGGKPGVLDPRVNENGQDLNRTYDPEDPFDPDYAPESNAVIDLVTALDPDLFFDYHGQGNYRSEDGKLDTMSVLWPTNENASADVVADAQRAVVALVDALDPYDHDQVTVYPGGSGANIGRNGFSLRDIPTVLVEQRFSQEMGMLQEGLDTDYSALISALALEGFITMKGVLEAMSDGSFEDIDPTEVADIPDRSPSVRFDDLYGDDEFVSSFAFA